MSEPFRTLRSAVVPLLRDDVDTDQVVPARFLKTTERDGLRDALFHDWRFTGEGSLRQPPFVLDRPEMAGRSILLAGANFGTGSSREHAAWALLANGIRCVLAVSFADIFRNNALKNGVLPVALSPAEHGRVAALVARDPGAALEVDLVTQSIRGLGAPDISFEIDPFSRQMLLAGTDEIGWVLEREAAIAAFESARAAPYDTRKPFVA